MIGNSDDLINFQHKLLLTNRQVANLCKAFANNSLVSIKLSKTQLSNMIRSDGFPGRLLGPLLINEKFNSTIGKKCPNSIRINSSNISSRYRYT